MRVVVVNHNGGGLTLQCLESILATDWPSEALETVLIDNRSDDGVAARVKSELPAVTVVESGANRGFAGGCNLAMEDLSSVDYVALVNNDATVEPGWLRPLVSALESDPGVGAASPKILFTDRFVDLRLESDTGSRGWGDSRQLGVKVVGARIDGVEAFGRLQLVDGFWGREHNPRGQAAFQWTSGAAHVRVPVRPDGSLPTLELLLAADRPRTAVTTSGAQRREHRVSRTAEWCEVPLAGEPFGVINNAGCALVDDGFGADRGLMEPDDGAFDLGEEVFAWCGAAVLLSRPYLEATGLFADRYFLYYEDFDLSWRGRAGGWRYLYEPASVVHHLHSATTVEGSPLTEHFVERNRLVTLTRNAPAGMALSAVTRHVAVTASYARRDIFSPLAHGRRPSVETVRRRMRALGGYIRLLPFALSSRRRAGRAGGGAGWPRKAKST